jgi:twinkle protein
MSEFSDLGIRVQEGRTRFYTVCPQCDPERKHKGKQSLTVNNEPGNRWFKCWNCSFSGNLDIQDKYKNVVENSRMPKQIPKTYTKEVREYFESRGIDQGIALKEGVFEYTLGGKPIIGFPSYINKTLVNVKYLNVRYQENSDGPKWWQMNREFGTKSIFMGMQSIRFERGEETETKRSVLITEGEIDMLTWKQCGYNNAVSVPQGAPSPKAKNFDKEFEYMEDPYVKSFFDPENVDLIIFSTDGDEPGKLLMNYLAQLFGKIRCKYINYPVGYKDINEVYKGSPKKNLPALGKKGVDECFDNLSSFPIKGVIRPIDLVDELEKYAKHGFVPGLGIGIKDIDDLFTLKQPHITFITGAPGAGKSVFVRWYLTQFVKHNQPTLIKWAMFTPENRPVAREYAKLAEAITGKRFQEGFSSSMPKDLRDKTMRSIGKNFFIVSPDRNSFETWGNKITAEKVNTLESILKYLIYLKKTEDIFGYVIDAWNKIEHEQPKNITETSFISQQLDYLISFNEAYNVHGIVIVHPRKIEFQGINYKMPNLYDIKGSSAWKEKADIGIVLHRNKMRRRPSGEIPENASDEDKVYVDDEAPTILKTEKIRFEEIGKERIIKLAMDMYGRFAVIKKDGKPSVSEDVFGDEERKKLNPKINEHDENDDNLPF